MRLIRKRRINPWEFLPRTMVLAIAVFLLETAALGQEGEPRRWIPGPPPNITEGTATIAVLPDTEYYAWKYPDLFYAQTGWIAQEARRRNIVYTLHLGDITQHNNHDQWTVARRSFAMLDGKVPYALVRGNDDYDNLVDNDWKQLRESSKINRYFDPAQIAKWPTFGGFFQEGRLENTWHLFRMHERDWMILCLEMGPRDEVINWADQLLSRNGHRRTIVVTHAYLFRNNQRYDHRNGKERASPHPWGNDGEELWQKLIRKHANIMMSSAVTSAPVALATGPTPVTTATSSTR